MTQIKQIAIIGCGGINSWAVKHLREIVDIFDKKLIYVKLFDDDIIEEKNLLRKNQNFLIEDLMQQKAEVLSKRYDFDYDVCFITEENINKLDTFDDIIMGVDNHKTRKLIYDYCIKKKKYLLDLKAQGTQMGFVVLEHNRGMEYYDNKYFNNKDVMERKGSCQLTSDIENDNIKNSNKTIAHLGIYILYHMKLMDNEPGIKELMVAF